MTKIFDFAANALSIVVLFSYFYPRTKSWRHILFFVLFMGIETILFMSGTAAGNMAVYHKLLFLDTLLMWLLLVIKKIHPILCLCYALITGAVVAGVTTIWGRLFVVLTPYIPHQFMYYDWIIGTLIICTCFYMRRRFSAWKLKKMLVLEKSLHIPIILTGLYLVLSLWLIPSLSSDNMKAYLPAVCLILPGFTLVAFTGFLQYANLRVQSIKFEYDRKFVQQERQKVMEITGYIHNQMHYFPTIVRGLLYYLDKEDLAGLRRYVVDKLMMGQENIFRKSKEMTTVINSIQFIAGDLVPGILYISYMEALSKGADVTFQLNEPIESFYMDEFELSKILSVFFENSIRELENFKTGQEKSLYIEIGKGSVIRNVPDNTAVYILIRNSMNPNRPKEVKEGSGKGHSIAIDSANSYERCLIQANPLGNDYLQMIEIWGTDAN